MRLIIATLIVFSFGLQTSGLARDEIRIISEEAGRLVVDVRFDDAALSAQLKDPSLSVPGTLPFHSARFYVAVRDTKNLSMKIVDGAYTDSKGGLPELDQTLIEQYGTPGRQGGFLPSFPCIASEPFHFRKSLVIAVNCFAEQGDYTSDTKRRWSSYRVEVRFTSPPKPASGQKPDPLLKSLVLNKNSLPAVDPGAGVRPRETHLGAASPGFSMSANWVKITVDKRDIYAITGNDLAQQGVNISSIDPESFRLLTAGGVEQPLSLTDSSGTWLADNWMQECAILVRGGEDGDFGPSDTLVFYGLGSLGWLNLYKPGAPRDTYTDHPYSKENVYFLTWGGSFSGAPLRMDTVPAPPLAAPEYTSYEKREHYERDLFEDFDYGGDGWFWLDIPRKTGPEAIVLHNFLVEDLIASVPQQFRTIAIAPYCGSKYCTSKNLNANHHAVYLLNSAIVTEKTWDVAAHEDHYDSGIPISVSGAFLQEGLNTFSFSIPRDLNPEDFMLFDYFELLYHRALKAKSDVLAFSSPDTTGTINMKLRDFSTSGSIFVFDVTDPYHPEVLDGFEVNSVQSKREIRFSSSLSSERKYYWASPDSRFRRLPRSGIERYFPTDLRNATTSPHMLIVCHEQFREAANVFKAYRETNLPYFSNPRLDIVTIQEVFDNFSGALPDPMAIRNYCRFLYDFTDGSGSPLLTYLLLFGDANTDYKNIISQQPDYVPTNINLKRKIASGVGAYATDEWFALMDSTDKIPGFALPDIAVGRLPSGSLGEAFFLVEKTIQYETADEFHPWRGKIILAADDEVYSGGKNQIDFVLQSEFIATAVLPKYIDFHKLYLTEFPWLGTIKPASRIYFLKKWNEGALIINYIGHGSSQAMADEQLFLGSDVAKLENGHKLPLFMAMSCTIGDFDNPLSKSLSEKLLLKEGGGAIGCITASQESFIGANANLNYKVFKKIFSDTPGPPEPLGVGLILAKIEAALSPAPNAFQVENNQKYNLLGDPSLQLLIPRNELRFDNNDADTLIAGVRKMIGGSVYKGGTVDTTFSGIAHLLVREPDDLDPYITVLGSPLYYRYHRGVLYRGTSEVERGRFSFSFRVPRFPSIGPYIYLTAYAEDGRRDGIVTKNTVDFALVGPSASDPVEPDDGPPRVSMGFPGGLEVVKPGAILQAEARDADGINILSTINEGKQALIFDDTNLPIDVTEFFAYDHGGSDTSGVLRYPLANISTGKHKAVYKVSDSFGQTTIDTLFFAVTDPLDYYAEAVFNYPNPFSQSTHFLFMLSDPGRIRLELFTVSGRRIRKLEESGSAGEAWVFWDGRDETGDEIANGTYLYVARIEFFGIDRPPVVLRGKLVKIE